MYAEGVNLHVVNGGGATVCARYWVPNEVGGGCRDLGPGQVWDVWATARWQSATMWASRGGCGGQPCNMGPPSGFTQFEFTLGGFDNKDYYDVSTLAGFNMGVSVIPTNGACPSQTCLALDRCQGALPYALDATKACSYGSTDYTILFSPS